VAFHLYDDNDVVLKGYMQIRKAGNKQSPWTDSGHPSRSSNCLFNLLLQRINSHTFRLTPCFTLIPSLNWPVSLLW